MEAKKVNISYYYSSEPDLVMLNVNLSFDSQTNDLTIENCTKICGAVLYSIQEDVIRFVGFLKDGSNYKKVNVWIYV